MTNKTNIIQGDLVFFDKKTFITAKNKTQLGFKDYRIYGKMCDTFENLKHDFYIVTNIKTTISQDTLYTLKSVSKNKTYRQSIVYITNDELKWICKL